MHFKSRFKITLISYRPIQIPVRSILDKRLQPFRINWNGHGSCREVSPQGSIDRKYNSYNFFSKLLLFHFVFQQNAKQKSNFPQIGRLVTKDTAFVCLKRASLYFKGMPTSIEFNDGIFFQINSVRIIVVPCF